MCNLHWYYTWTALFSANQNQVIIKMRDTGMEPCFLPFRNNIIASKTERTQNRHFHWYFFIGASLKQKTVIGVFVISILTVRYGLDQLSTIAHV